MKKFTPNLMVKDLRSIPLEELKAKGIKCLLFDVDNTIVPYNSQGLTDDTIAWFDIPRKMGFVMGILSNNKGERLKPVAEKLGIPFIARSKKPLSYGAKRAMALLGVKPEETAMVGDQLITDILCGNRMGFYTIVVEPLNKNELWLTRFNRNFERLIYRSIRRRNRIR
ncbi:MAG: YqeG family HAD IIIA-type phosphatase [Bacillota bacterium]|nr:YqeG family HAD IIIA-type phosphatase [Bacillota bacterium]